MRLIDADALEKTAIPFETHGGGRFIALGSIRTAPTIDAVPVVRCKDCKHNPEFKTKRKGWVWCRNFRTEVDATGFCSYGERKE